MAWEDRQLSQLTKLEAWSFRQLKSGGCHIHGTSSQLHRTGTVKSSAAAVISISFWKVQGVLAAKTSGYIS